MRKTVVAIAIALTTVLSVNSQDLRKNEVDEFTGVTKKVTKFYKVAKGDYTTVEMSVARLDKTLGMYVRTDLDLGCSGSVGEYIIFKFTDGTTLKYEGIGSIDCGDDATSIFMFKYSDFKGKTVEKIRIKRSEYYADCLVKGKYTINQLINAVK